jgi:putative IMPACT (imprinted ancient) family translation regulator
VPAVRLALRLPYEKVGAVKRLVHPPEVELEAEEYGEDALVVLSVHEGRVAALREALADLGIAVT